MITIIRPPSGTKGGVHSTATIAGGEQGHQRRSVPGELGRHPPGSPTGRRAGSTCHPGKGPVAARQSPGLWHRLEGGALPAGLPGKRRAQILRQAGRQKVLGHPPPPGLPGGSGPVEDREVQGTGTPLHRRSHEIRAIAGYPEGEAVMVGEQSQQRVFLGCSEPSHFSPDGSSGCADWGAKYAVLPKTPVRSH